MRDPDKVLGSLNNVFSHFSPFLAHLDLNQCTQGGNDRRCSHTDPFIIQMTKLDLTQQKAQLLQMKAALSARLQQSDPTPLGQEPSPHTRASLEIEQTDLEHAQKISLKEDVYAKQDFELKEMDAIENALKRIEEGRYGVCQMCGQAMDPKRLHVAPEALNCVSCQSNLEA